MACLSSISDTDLLARVPVLLTRERAATAELIAYLAEIDRRRLYLEQACSSLRAFCMERLGYSEDEASKRVRVAQLARQLPGVLDELRSGAIHLTGLFLLAPYLTHENADALLAEARGLSRQGIEQLVARWFPKPDVESRIDPIASQSALPLGEQGAPRSGRPAASTCPGTDPSLSRAKLEPLSASRFRVQFTASDEPTVENLCLLCASHNAYTARQVFGEAHIEKRRREQTERTVCSALSHMGFRKHEALQALSKLRTAPIAPGTRPLLRAALALMVPANVSAP